MTGNPEPTQRFTHRVEDYVRARPSYPALALEALADICGLLPGCDVADVGAGTGIFSELLLAQGLTVHAIEPNDAMRAAAEARLDGRPGYVSLAGTAEDTGLPAASIDLITAAQAFHWFDQDRARAEWQRVLRPAGWVALLWNERLTDVTPFAAAYEALLLRFGTDYAQVDHRQVDDARFGAFFGPSGYQLRTFPNAQLLDHAGLVSRLCSSSYTPGPDHPAFAPMMARLDEIFQAHQIGGLVEITYETQLFVGRLS